MAMFSTSDFGTPSLNPLTRQRNALTSAYRRGIRDLRRASRNADRNGDVGAVAAAAKGQIELLKEAGAQGIQASGISRFEDRRAADINYANSLVEREQINRSMTNKALRAVGGYGKIPTREPGFTTGPADETAAAATPTAASRSFAQIATEKANMSAASGAFGRSAQQKAPGATNLEQRQALYGEMAQAREQNQLPETAGNFYQRARQLGVTGAGFDRAYQRLQDNPNMAAADKDEDDKKKVVKAMKASSTRRA